MAQDSLSYETQEGLLFLDHVQRVYSVLCRIQSDCDFASALFGIQHLLFGRFGGSQNLEAGAAGLVHTSASVFCVCRGLEGAPHRSLADALQPFWPSVLLQSGMSNAGCRKGDPTHVGNTRQAHFDSAQRSEFEP